MSSSDAGSSEPIDFVSLCSALLDRAEELVARWLPEGRRQGHEWVCGDLQGGKGSSLSINLNTGRWADFSTDEKGGDLLALFAAIHGLSQSQAARQLMRMLGWEKSQPAQAASQPEAKRGAADEVQQPRQGRGRSEWRAIVPVPSYVQPPPRFTWSFHNQALDAWTKLEAVRVWEYRFQGQLYGFVARFERIDSQGVVAKDTIPFTFCKDLSNPRGTQEWRHKTWEVPRPLYVPATELAADARLVPVVLSEGEKCAEGLHQLLGHEFDAVSWPGGTKSWQMAAWSWLRGRVVYLWPDCDAKRVRLTAAEREAGVDPATKPLLPEAKQPGMQAMVGIGSLLLAEMGCTVLMCPVPRPGEVADGWDVADAIAEGWDAARVRDFIRAARPFVPPDDSVRAAAGISTPSKAAAREGTEPKAADDEALRWKRHLVTSAQGAVKAVRENVVLALDGWPEKDVPGIPACAGLIRFNEFSNNVEKVRETPWGSPQGDWLEADELQLGDWLLREYQMPSMSRQALEEAVLVVSRRHAYHPVRERLLALRGRWDQVNRLDCWLRRCMLEEDEWDEREPLQQYLTLAGRWFLMGMVARVMPVMRDGARIKVGPGVKFDYMLVLEGPQGWGKSTVAATLGGEHFSDTALVIGDKDSYQNIQGILVVEWSELENMSKQEVTRVKQFISSPSDRFRATFDRRPAKYPRQCVFIGTTNEANYLTDTTGNRRFWPVRATRAPDSDWLRENLEQLLAEAVHRVDAGERFWPTREEQRLLFDPQQHERTVESSLEASIRVYLYDPDQRVPHGGDNGTLRDEIGLVELLTRVGYPVDKQTDAVVKKAGAIMHMLGWTVRRTSAPGRPRVYVRPRPAAAWPRPGGSNGSGSSGPSSDNGPPQGPDDGDPNEPPF